VSEDLNAPRVFIAELSKVTSYVYWMRTVSFEVTGAAEELEVVCRKVRRHNLLAGWWSLPGIVRTPWVLRRNADVRRQLRALASRPAVDDEVTLLAPTPSGSSLG